MTSAATAAALLSLVAVTYAPPASALPPVPSDAQYWFGNLRIAQVWGLGATGRGVTVAVLDSGVQSGGVELGDDVVRAGTNFAGGDGRTDSDTPRGHGTAMARMIAGQGGGRYDLTGIAPDAKILPVTADPGNLPTDQLPARWSQSVRYAADHGAKVINMSIGADAPGGTCPAALASAVAYAVGKGAVVVASAGNDGTTTNAPQYPGVCPGVVAVGAVDGSRKPWVKSQRQSYVDIASAGVDFPDENLAGTEGTSSGTSNAAALVSASLALIWSKLPKLTNRQVVARLLATVTDDTQTPGHDDVTGYGIARPYFAITQNVPANAPNPVFDEIKASPSTAPSSSAGAGSTAGSDGPTGGSASSPAKVRAEDSDSGSSGLVIGGIVVAALLVAGLVVFLVVRSRSRRPAGFPGGPGGPGQGPPPPGHW